LRAVIQYPSVVQPSTVFCIPAYAPTYSVTGPAARAIACTTRSQYVLYTSFT
jgi:hypothetical protein